MEPSESITNPQELDETVYKFTEACNTAFKEVCEGENIVALDWCNVPI